MRRDGFALVFALLALAAVELLTLASLALATHETLVADARLRTIIASRAADAALASLTQTSPLGVIDSMRVGQRLVVPAGNRVSIEIERTGWSLFHAVASANAARVTVRRAAVWRRLDVARALEESSEAVVAAGPIFAPLAQFDIDHSRTCTLPVGIERQAAGVTLSNRRHAWSITDARIDSAHAVLPAGYALAGVRWDELASIADIQAGTTIQLAATDSTGAVIYPLIFADGDLNVTSGNGQGLIFVDGNLQIQSGVQFHGVIVVHGTVAVADDVHVTGALRIQGNAMSTMGRATFTHSRCVIATSFMETPAAVRLIRGFRTRIPAF